MKTYISILRGINVGGHRKIKMDELKKMYENLGFWNVKTYIQSGNIIFQTPDSDELKLAALISEEIERTFLLDVIVIVKSSNDLKYIHDNNPFLAESDKEIDSLYVTFLSEKPIDSAYEKFEQNYIGYNFLLRGSVIYLFCPEGYGKTKYSNNFFEKKLKISATTRNWKTLIRLQKMLIDK